MPQKKPSSLLTDSDLINMIEQHESEEAPDTSSGQILFETVISNFIRRYDLKPGKDPVPYKLLYTIFSHTEKEQPLDRQAFCRIMGYFFTKQGDNFLINQNSFTLSNKAKEIFQPKRQLALKNPKVRTFFELFLNTFEIKKGNKYIKGDVLYFIYDKWKYENKYKTKLSRYDFYIFLDSYFSRKIIDKIKYYGITEDIKKYVTSEEFKTAEEWHQKNKQQYETQKNFKTKQK